MRSSRVFIVNVVWTDLIYCYNVSIVGFEQVNTNWELK